MQPNLGSPEFGNIIVQPATADLEARDFFCTDADFVRYGGRSRAAIQASAR
jgi:hypothetical protein